jgi:hypothetical protein
MNYLIIKNNIIANIIVADEAFAKQIDALPWYVGAEIGRPYSPPPAPMTIEETILDKLTELEYRQDLRDLGLTEGGAGV